MGGEHTGRRRGKPGYTIPMGELRVRPAHQAALREAGVGSVHDVLLRSACLRDLPDRSNHRLEAGGLVIFVKRRKPGRFGAVRNAELEGCEAAAQLGIPTAEVVLSAEDPAVGAVVGHLSLAPARPLDDLLGEGALEGAGLERVFSDLAHAVATLHDARRHHRDLYLNHVFVDPSHEAPVRGILDWERSGAHRRAWGRWVVKDLAALRASGAPDRFFDRYRALRGSPWPAYFDGRIDAKAAKIRAHVPRTPVGPDAPKGDA